MIEMVSEPYTSNGAVDNIVLSATEQFDIPIIPPDYPFPENQRQAKDAYGFNKTPKTGFVYTYPLAVALYGEEGPEPIDCIQHTTESECILNGCHWWSDGTCHDTPETPVEFGWVLLALLTFGWIVYSVNV